MGSYLLNKEGMKNFKFSLFYPDFLVLMVILSTK